MCFIGFLSIDILEKEEIQWLSARVFLSGTHEACWCGEICYQANAMICVRLMAALQIRSTDLRSVR
jgi:hypothetical protein